MLYFMHKKHTKALSKRSQCHVYSGDTQAFFRKEGWANVSVQEIDCSLRKSKMLTLIVLFANPKEKVYLSCFT